MRRGGARKRWIRRRRARGQEEFGGVGKWGRGRGESGEKGERRITRLARKEGRWLLEGVRSHMARSWCS